MRRRAEHVEGTRQRIVEATVRLHTTIGPASTTISTIAEEAGVTRLTVYRHFADLDELFESCRGHWLAEHRPPNVAAWRTIADLADRARRGFGELYGWFRANADDLYPINRDEPAMPSRTQAQRQAQSAAIADALVAGGAGEPNARALRAAAGHLVSYWTWRSLVVEQGLTNEEAIELAVSFLLDAAGSADRPSPG